MIFSFCLFIFFFFLPAALHEAQEENVRIHASLDQTLHDLNFLWSPCSSPLLPEDITDSFKHSFKRRHFRSRLLFAPPSEEAL